MAHNPETKMSGQIQEEQIPKEVPDIQFAPVAITPSLPLGDFKCIVVDGGSVMIKAGFAGDDTPRVIFPAVVGRRRRGGIMSARG